MTWALLENSLAVGISVAILSVAIGFFCALCLAGLPDRLRPWFLAVAIVALALPPFLVTNCWLHFFGQTGVWRSWISLNVFSLGGAVWILALLLWPFSLLLVWGAWQRLEPSQLESDMQVTGLAFLRALLLPLARSALVQSGVLSLVLALNNFSVPAILQVKVFTAEMWVRFNTTFDTPGTLKLSWPLLVCPLLVLVCFSKRDIAWPHLSSPVSGQLFRQQLGPVWFWSSTLFSFFVFLCSVFLPLFQILSLERTWTELPGALAAGQSAAWNSLWYAGGAATIVLGLSLSALGGGELRNGLFGFRPSGLFRISGFAFRIFTWLAFLLPGVLLGIGLIHTFNHSWTAGFYQSAGIVILAFVIRYLAIGWSSVQHSSFRVDPDLIAVAQLEGANHWQMLRQVVWPQIARPALVTWYLLFVLCLWDVESMILVVPPGGETLALRIFNLLHYGHNAQVNALCFTLLLLALTPLALQAAWGVVRRIRHKISGYTLAKPAILASTAGIVLLQLSCSRSQNASALSSQFFVRAETIGTRGVGVGQLNKPRSLALDASDNLYVVDMTGRVQKFSTNGTFLLSWQMPQIELGKPKGMCRDREGNILVVEPHYSRVNVFSPFGKLLAQWGKHGTNAGQLSLPRAAAVNSQGKIFVSEYQEAERVQTFAFAADGANDRTPSDSSALRDPPRWTGGFGQAGTGPGDFNRPEGLCFDSHDQLYVADSCNHRIQIFSSEGKFLRAYGKPGKGLGELSYPYDICVDKAGRQYVCEFGNSRIQIFDASDRPLEIIGGPGAGPGYFGNPWGVALDSKGNLFIADSQNHRVQKLVRKQ